ncbi:MAG: hypothetical protein J7M14_01090 [Planctomycetes bacterium]|nr:hypothetical protein [Planctomycetota bacterium]
MFEEAILAEQFEDLLAQTRRAEQMYTALADSVKDPVLRKQISRLCADKHRHVQLAQRLLEIVD